MTGWSADLTAFVGELMTSPKTTTAATGVAAGTSAALGAATALDWIHGLAAIMAIGASVIATLALARFHQAGTRSEKLRALVLEAQLREMGVDPKVE